ncbi:MAG: hypothetical protein HRU20_30350 [Pseudomonadales bacterium]|nr:hypothetical protein [Pseudomonadales bacterium]
MKQAVKTTAVSVAITLGLITQARAEGKFSLYAPLHMPNLQMESVGVDMSVGDLARMANAYFTLGMKYENNDFYVDYDGWYGSYGSELGPNSDFNMKQQIHNLDVGLPLFAGERFTLHATAGVRYYNQLVEMDIFSGSLEKPVDWVEATLGLKAEYRFTPRHSITAKYSQGHEGSERLETYYQYKPKHVFFRAGYRIDEFESDGVHVKENGGLFTIGYEW